MITTILQGRTGNNLFQYAVGRALADKLGVDLVLDGSWAPPSVARQFDELKRLPLRTTYVRRNWVAKLALKKLAKAEPGHLHRGPVYKETTTGFRPEVLEMEDGTLLHGYFQCPGYGAELGERLRNDLDLDGVPLADGAMRLRDRFTEGVTVSLHVRRGDYLNIKATHCLTEDYHDRAMAWFRERFGNVRFCVFSDDITWCRGRFIGDEFLFSDFPEASNPFHDMKLMAGCHHHIIVNSSYSWWGAWLNPSKEKQVLVPERWMARLQSSIVVPDEWTII